MAVSGDVEELDGREKNTLRVFKNITLVHEAGMVLLEVRGQTRGAPVLGLVQFSIAQFFSDWPSPILG